MNQQVDFFDESGSTALGESAAFSGSLPPGLIVVPDFISKADEFTLLSLLDDTARSRWSCELQRRVQQYGFRYNYKARALTTQDRIGDLPEWASQLGQRLVERGYFADTPDQVIVNEYQPGQGISPHIDRTTCFGKTVASLSLGSPVVMDFCLTDAERGCALLPRRSLLVLREDARNKWTHAIASRRRDTINSFSIARTRRVSLTFRTVLLEEKPE